MKAVSPSWSKTVAQSAGFEASCNSREPLDLPDHLYQVLFKAWLLNELDEDLATMH